MFIWSVGRVYILTGNRVSLTMSLVGFSKLIHFDVLLGNAKCTILVLNMRWVNLHSVNLIDQEPEVLTDWFLWWLCALHTLLRTLLAMGSTDRLPEEGGRLLRPGGFGRERIGKEHWYLKVVFRRMSVIQTKQGIFDISQHIQRFIWRYTGLVFIPLFQMCACFQGKSVSSACLAPPKQVKLKKKL